MRVFGGETEYGLTARTRLADGRWRRMACDDAAQTLFASVASEHATTNVAPHFSAIVASPRLESPAMTCSRRQRPGSANGSSLVLMSGRDFVVSGETRSRRKADRCPSTNRPDRNAPAPQMICRVTRNGTIASVSSA